MRIANVKTTAFKGSDLNVNLTPVTWLYGDNFAGKTTVVQAIALALCGTVPGMASSRGSDIHRALASGATMSVSIGTEDVTKWIGRTWTMDAKGGVKYFDQIHGFVKDYKADPRLFAPQSFLEMSGPERIRHLFATLPPPSLEKVGPEAIVTMLKNYKSEPHTDAHEVAVNEACEVVRASYKENVTPSGRTIQEWLQDFAALVKDKAGTAKKVAGRMGTTAVGVVQLKGEAMPLAQAEQKKKAAQTKLDKANEAVTTAREAYKTKDWELKGGVAQIEQSWLDAVGYLEDQSSIETGVAESILRYKEHTHGEPEFDPAKVAIETGLPIWVGPTVTELQADVTRMERALAALPQVSEVGYKTARENLAKATDAVRLAAAGCVKLNTARESISKAINEITECEGCPYCKSKKKGWKDDLLAEKNTEFKALTLEYEAAIADKASKDATVAACQKIIEAADTTRQNRALALGQAQTAGAALQAAQRQVEAQRAIVDAHAGWQAAVTAATAKVPALKAELDAMKTNGLTLATAAEQAKTELAEAQTAHNQSVAENATKKQVADATAALDKAKAEEAVWKHLASLLQALATECVEQSIKPLLALCNCLCGGILRAPLAYEDEKLGMMRTTGFVPWLPSTFSGTEAALASCILGVALAAQGDIKIAVVDELGRLDNARKLLVLERLLDLVSKGIIDQAIVIDVGPPPSGRECEQFSAVEIK